MIELVAAADPHAALAIHVALAAGIVAAVMLLAALLRERRRDAVTDVAYESGIVPRSLPNRPLNAPYFLIAALFVVFDMAAAILAAWAVAAREAGPLGLGAAALFILLQLAALAYLRADGALDFTPGPRR